MTRPTAARRPTARPFTRTVIAGLWLAALFVFPPPAESYTEPTHYRIVVDAVDFIIAARNETWLYVDGSTGLSDYQLLRSSFPNLDDAGLRRRAEELGQASAETDRRTDVWLKFPGLFGSSSEAGRGGVSFTTFSHFINVKSPGFAWQFSGYYYGWVEQNQPCSNAGLEDRIANFFAGNSKGRVDIDKSEAFTIYKDPLLPTISDKQYRDHFDQRIRHVHFWPLTNLANYWLQKFVGEPRGADGSHYNIAWIGPVLHAAGDSTVPYHAAGLSGCGHGVYEDGIEALYDTGVLFDRGVVTAMLAKEKHLDRRLSVAEIVVENARRAADAPFCKCGLRSCDCPIARNPKVGTSLVNLAIASTVVVLRKALSEWQARGGALAARKDVSPRIVVEREVQRYSAMLEVPEMAPIVLSADLREAQAMVTALTPELNRMRELVGGLELRRVSAGSFRPLLETKVADIAAIVGRYPKADWNPLQVKFAERPAALFRLGSPPLRFRAPSLGDLKEGLANYIQARHRFFDAHGLYITGLTRGAVLGRLPRLGADERREAEEYLVELKKGQENYIAYLER